MENLFWALRDLSSSESLCGGRVNLIAMELLFLPVHFFYHIYDPIYITRLLSRDYKKVCQIGRRCGFLAVIAPWNVTQLRIYYVRCIYSLHLNCKWNMIWIVNEISFICREKKKIKISFKGYWISAHFNIWTETMLSTQIVWFFISANSSKPDCQPTYYFG